MPPKQRPILRQEDFLYDLDWDDKIDRLFIDVLSFQSVLENFVWGAQNEEAVKLAKEAIECSSGKNFSLAYCNEKVELLEKRYTVFCWILSVEGVAYDKARIIVTAEPVVWEYIMKRNSFAFAYMSKGEPQYDELKVIFGASPNEVEERQRKWKVKLAPENGDEKEDEDDEGGQPCEMLDGIPLTNSSAKHI